MGKPRMVKDPIPQDSIQMSDDLITWWTTNKCSFVLYIWYRKHLHLTFARRMLPQAKQYDREMHASWDEIIKSLGKRDESYEGVEGIYCLVT